MKRNWWLRIPLAILFVAMSAFVMLSMYKLSSEDGGTSGLRTEIVGSALKEEVNALLENNEKGLAIKERVKYWVIRHSPYGSDWTQNLRKLAHFTIYFMMAIAIYITLWILGLRPGTRFLITLMICLLYSLFDETHQSSIAGRGMSLRDVFIDCLGAGCAVVGMSAFSWLMRFLFGESK